MYTAGGPCFRNVGSIIPFEAWAQCQRASTRHQPPRVLVFTHPPVWLLVPSRILPSTMARMASRVRRRGGEHLMTVDPSTELGVSLRCRFLVAVLPREIFRLDCRVIRFMMARVVVSPFLFFSFRFSLSLAYPNNSQAPYSYEKTRNESSDSCDRSCSLLAIGSILFFKVMKET